MRYLLTHLLPLVFILSVILYIGLTVWVCIRFAAPIGTIAIFLNNMIIGVAMFWYRQQSIEYKFVSISDFIQAFPDRTNSHGNMDEVSLSHAARLMEKLTLTESAEPAYSSYMKEFWWSNKNYTSTARMLHHVGMGLLIVAFAGAAIGYFLFLGRFDLKSRWSSEISPCIYVCTKGSNSTAAMCQWCACECLAALLYKDPESIAGCPEHLSVPSCKYAGNGGCPATCWWKT